VAPKHFTREDKLARTPALAVAWHLPPRMTKDFFALSVLDPLLNSDDSARMHRKLVREDRLAMSVVRRLQLPRQQLGHAAGRCCTRCAWII
jgi:zinc protease